MSVDFYDIRKVELFAGPVDGARVAVAGPKFHTVQSFRCQACGGVRCRIVEYVYSWERGDGLVVYTFKGYGRRWHA